MTKSSHFFLDWLWKYWKHRQPSIFLGEITIRMLMSHTSGLSQHAFPGYMNNIPSALDVLAGKGGINIKHVHLEGLPGHWFSYSGGGITVLQLILEHITNQAFPDLVRELVLDPLGMHRSFYAVSKEENYAVAQYTGFTACEVLHRANPEQAAAGLWTTPTDLLKLVRALQRSLKVNDHTELLYKEVAKEILTEISGTMAMGWLLLGNLGFLLVMEDLTSRVGGAFLLAMQT
jgi:CubicO group peptidase (beta-lactamase class C family)